jgi:hypothetical protein
MLKMQFKGIVSLLVLGILVSCNKKYEDTPVPDIFNPTIVITTPTQGSSENSLFPVNIVGTITDQLLDSLDIKVIEKNTGKVIKSARPDVKGKAGYTFNESFTQTVTGDPLECQLIIYGKDAADNLALATLDFFIVKI